MSDEKDSVITYEILYEVLRLEKYRAELQKLDDGFFSKFVKYLDEKKAILLSSESKDSVFASQSITKTRKQIENIQKLIKELYEKRESKIVQMAIYASRMDSQPGDIHALLPDEKDMYASLVEELNSFRSGILYNLLNAKKPKVIRAGVTKIEETKDKLSNKLVRFVQPVPQFIGEDMNIYGPFEAEDVANLPISVSEVLIKSSKVEELN